MATSGDSHEASGALDEVAAPAPVENPDEQSAYRTTHLERELGDGQQRGSHARGDGETRVARPRLEQEEGRTGVDEVDVPTAARKDESSSSDSNAKRGGEYIISPVATKIYTIGYLVLFSILGTLARLGLQALTMYPGAPVQQGLLWANVGGSFVMGFLSEDKKLFQQEWGSPPRTPDEKEGDVDPAAEKKRHSGVKKTIPLFIGLATGFCGSFTSFSSFQRDVFLELANSAPSVDTSSPLPRNGGYSFLAVLASLIITPGLSLAALSAGGHLALFTERFLPPLNFYMTRGLFDPLLSFVGFGCWLGAVFMAIWPPDRPHGPANPAHHRWNRETWRGEAIFALVFAPLGVITRYYVSLWLNARVASFPLGTFAVNMAGTLFETLFYDLQHAPLAHRAVGGGQVACQILQGLQDGFCGCLTTVSTWVAELKGLRRSHSYVYGLVSLGVGLAITVIVMGSLRWTHGFANPSCVT